MTRNSQWHALTRAWCFEDADATSFFQQQQQQQNDDNYLCWWNEPSIMFLSDDDDGKKINFRLLRRCHPAARLPWPSLLLFLLLVLWYFRGLKCGRKISEKGWNEAHCNECWGCCMKMSFLLISFHNEIRVNCCTLELAAVTQLQWQWQLVEWQLC